MRTVKLAILAGFLIAMVAIPALGQSNAPKLDVINHLFTSRVIQGKDGGFYPQDTLIGFERGTATFHTITHVVLEAGTYNLKMELKDPNGTIVASKALPSIKAQHDDWSEALWVEWPNVRFQHSGRYELSIVRDGKIVASFYLLIA